MAVKEQNFEMWAGDYKKVTFVVQDIENLVGANIQWIMAQSAKSEPVLTKESTANEININKNEFTVELSSVDTKDIAAGTYYHEAIITDTENHTVTVATGKVTINPSLKKVGVADSGEEGA